MGCCPPIPNIVIVYELVDNSLFTVLHMKRNIELTMPLRVKIALDCARVYLYMHNLGIVHRDIKSHNVLIDNNFNVKVCDFGLARFIVSTLSVYTMVIHRLSNAFADHPVGCRRIWARERCSLRAHLAIWHRSCFKSANTMRRSTCLPSARYCGRPWSAKFPTTASSLARFARRSRAARPYASTMATTSVFCN